MVVLDNGVVVNQDHETCCNDPFPSYFVFMFLCKYDHLVIVTSVEMPAVYNLYFSFVFVSRVALVSVFGDSANEC